MAGKLQQPGTKAQLMLMLQEFPLSESSAITVQATNYS